MNAKPWGLAAALCLIASIVAGCATAERPITTLTAEKQTGKVGPCEYEYEFGEGTKKVKNFKLKPGTDPRCKEEHFSSPLYIGSDPTRLLTVIEIGPVEMNVKVNPCSYCYTNTMGGLSCVWYPC